MQAPEIKSVYSPEELVTLTLVLGEVLDPITVGKTEADVAEIRALLGEAILDYYGRGETDPKRLKTIVLDRAKRFGFSLDALRILSALFEVTVAVRHVQFLDVLEQG